MSSSEFLFPKINPLKNKEYALYLLLSPTQNSQSSSYYPNQLLSLSLFSYKVIFKLLSSKPGDIIDSIPTRERARVLAHRHTHTYPSCFQSDNPTLASCTLSLLLSVSYQSLPLHSTSGPQHPLDLPAQSQESRRFSGSKRQTFQGQV